jgi:transcription termination/antitermination protein NusG
MFEQDPEEQFERDDEESRERVDSETQMPASAGPIYGEPAIVHNELAKPEGIERSSEQPTEGPAWYVIHCYSGYENKVRHNLELRIETMGMKDKVFDVVVPTQEEIEVREGKRRTVERHIFPGYVLVNMLISDESWFVVRNTPGVTGFVGMGNMPTPLRPEEVAQILKRMEAEAPTVKVTFKVGERVRIVDGPFNDFRGVVSEIDMERTKVRVMVSFFGRETPVELDFLQVEKA